MLARIGFSLVMLAMPASAMEFIHGWCDRAAAPVVSRRPQSDIPSMASYSPCTVTVFIAGSRATKAIIYADGDGAALANPFSLNSGNMDSQGRFFFSANGRFDVTISGGGLPAPYTFENVGDPKLATITDFGPAGTGVANSQPTVALALASTVLSGGGTIVFPPGVYDFLSGVTVGIDGTDIACQPGAIWRKSAFTGPVLTVSANDVTVTGCTFDEDFQSPWNSGAATVYSKGSIGLHFLDNEIENGYAMAMNTEDTSASFVSSNNLLGTYGPGIYIGNGSHGIRVANNTINKPQGTVSNSHGDGIAVAVTNAGATISGVTVDANSVYLASALGFCFEAGNFIAGSVDFSVVSGITFSGNSCVRPANVSGSYSYGGFSLSVMSDSAVTGNKDYDQGSFTSVGPIAGIEIICSRCDVSGNQLYSASVTGSANGITGSYDGSTISDNVVNGFYLHTAGAGIENHTTAYHTGISGNTITGNIVTLPAGAAQGLRGIAISCEDRGCVADNQRIVENVVVGNSAAQAERSEGIVFTDNTAGGAVSMAFPEFSHNSFHLITTGILSAGSLPPGIDNAFYSFNTCQGCSNQEILTATTVITGNPERQAAILWALRHSK